MHRDDCSHIKNERKQGKIKTKKSVRFQSSLSEISEKSSQFDDHFGQNNPENIDNQPFFDLNFNGEAETGRNHFFTPKNGGSLSLIY